MNKKKRVKIFALLLVVYATVLFVECSVYFPSEMKLLNGEKIDTPKGFAYTVETASNADAYETYDATVKLFGLIPVKEINVSILPEMEFTAGGKSVGIKMFTKGLICVGHQNIKGVDGVGYNVSKAVNIKDGDMILSANGVTLNTIEQFSEIIESSNGQKISLLVQSNGKDEIKEVTPVLTDSGYKLGLWVRDSTAGIGTVTFVERTQGIFAALGHPITDVDTGMLMPIDKGTITNAEISGVQKGERGNPGELYGIFGNQDCGVILKNTKEGIYGKMVGDCRLTYDNDIIDVAPSQQVKTGKAEIYANIDGNQIEKFDIEISKIMRYAQDEKNLIIRITDKRLLERTGGIVQGMSGSPIIQNGKLVGAVTHVFVNDASRGYGILIENMLKETK